MSFQIFFSKGKPWNFQNSISYTVRIKFVLKRASEGLNLHMRQCHINDKLNPKEILTRVWFGSKADLEWKELRPHFNPKSNSISPLTPVFSIEFNNIRQSGTLDSLQLQERRDHCKKKCFFPDSDIFGYLTRKTVKGSCWPSIRIFEQKIWTWEETLFNIFILSFPSPCKIPQFIFIKFYKDFYSAQSKRKLVPSSFSFHLSS